MFLGSKITIVLEAKFCNDLFITTETQINHKKNGIKFLTKCRIQLDIFNCFE